MAMVRVERADVPTKNEPPAKISTASSVVVLIPFPGTQHGNRWTMKVSAAGIRLLNRNRGCESRIEISFVSMLSVGICVRQADGKAEIRSDGEHATARSRHEFGGRTPFEIRYSISRTPAIYFRCSSGLASRKKKVRGERQATGREKRETVRRINYGKENEMKYAKVCRMQLQSHNFAARCC